MARKCVHETFKSENQILWLSLNFQVASSAYHLHGRTRHSIWKTSENVGLEVGGGGGEAMFVLFSVCFPFVGVACEQALRGGAGQGGKRKESLQIHLWNLNSISNSPVAPRQLSCHIFTNQGEAEMSAKLM